MTLAVRRDLDALRTGLERWLGRGVGEITRPSPGYSCETLIVESDLIVRLPPVGDGTFPVYDLAQQAAVQTALGAAGVPVPKPCRYEPDPEFLGAPFLTMPFVAGPIPSDFTPTDNWLAGLADDADRHAVWLSTMDTIARIHAASTDGLALRAGLAAELAYWSDYIGWACDGAPPPGLADAFAWCTANVPSSEPDSRLLWGDVRYGNIVYDEVARAPRAVLDWDMVSAGAPEMDIAWLLALEQVQFDLTKMSVPGFGARADAVALFEARLGRQLTDLEWYETFALVRASAISTRIAVLFDRAGERSMFKIGEDPTLAAALARISAA